jgi:hypothetical protein
MAWTEVVQFLGGATAISLTLAYLGRKAIEAYLNGRLERYRSDLQRLATEHSVRFQSLHSERAQVLKEFYSKLVELDDALHSALRSFQLVGEEPLDAKVATLSRLFNELRAYFAPRRIFFEPQMCTEIDRLLEIAKGIFIDITVMPVDPSHPQYKYDRAVLKERHEFWEKARKAHKNEFATIKAKIEEEFRKILGIWA